MVDVQATLLQLHASDRSQYISKNPKIYATYSVPRLAQVMSIDSLTVRVDHSRADGLLVSGRLMGATAKGWPGESGSMISRCLSLKHTSHMIVHTRLKMMCGPCDAADLVPHVNHVSCQALCLRYTSLPVQSTILILEACTMVCCQPMSSFVEDVQQSDVTPAHEGRFSHIHLSVTILYE